MNKKTNEAIRLYLKLVVGYGDDVEEEELDDEDSLSDFFDQVLSGDLDQIPEEDDSVEEVDTDETDLETVVPTETPEAVEVPADKTPAAKEAEVVAPVVPNQEQPADPVVVEAPAPVAQTQEQAEAEYKATIGELEKVYAISDEDADAILTDPKTVLPRLQAQAHVMMVKTMTNMMVNMMPMLLEQTTKEQTTKAKALSEFATAWPELADKAVEPTVIQAVVAVRKQFPNLAGKELFAKVGPVAYALLGKAMPSQEKPPVEVVKKAKPTPFTPAKATGAPPKAAPTNAVDAFFNDIYEGKI